MVDLTIKKGQVSHVKVKTADLKANLSRYLRQVREQGESIEILLREETVAYLTPACGNETQSTKEMLGNKALEHAFGEVGLTCQLGRGSLNPQAASPDVAGDGITDINSVASMRAEKDW